MAGLPQTVAANLAPDLALAEQVAAGGGVPSNRHLVGAASIRRGLGEAKVLVVDLGVG